MTRTAIIESARSASKGTRNVSDELYQTLVDHMVEVKSTLGRIEAEVCGLRQRVDGLERNDKAQDAGLVAVKLLQSRVIFWAAGAVGVLALIGSLVGLGLGIAQVLS